MRHKTLKPPGTPPGTLLRDPERLSVPSRLSLIYYEAQALTENHQATVDDCLNSLKQPGNVWIHLQGLQNIDLLNELGKALKLHPLALEDVADGRAPIKAEDYGDYLFLIIKLLTFNSEIKDEQICLFWGERFLLSIQESDIDHFAPIRERLISGHGVIRQHGTDYLAYTLLDVMIDSWFPLLERLGERIEDIEDMVLARPDPKVMSDLQRLRRIFLRARRLVWPLRDTINTLLREDNPLISANTRVYLRDCYDHAFQVIDILEYYRDMATGIIEVYLSSLDTRLNEVMKVLTVIATIFMPMTFVAGIYGMNFKTDASPWNMPELGWYYGYPFFWGLIVIIVIIMLSYFRHRKWI